MNFVTRWLLLAATCAVLLGVVAMHHVPAADTHGDMAVTATVSDAPALSAPMPDHHPMTHDVLHDCLAILAQAGFLLLALTALALVFRVSVRVSRLTRRPRAPDPPPKPRYGRVLLTSVCVLRI